MTNRTEFNIIDWNYKVITESMPWIDKETGMHGEESYIEVLVELDYEDTTRRVSFVCSVDEDVNEFMIKHVIKRGYHDDLFYEILGSNR